MMTLARRNRVLLFSYGTLRQEAVQRTSFGRLLEGTPDWATGYRLGTILIADPDVVALSESSEHPVMVFTGNPNDRVAGSVLEISESELAAADSYEVAAYKRVEIKLTSGRVAWAYARA